MEQSDELIRAQSGADGSGPVPWEGCMKLAVWADLGRVAEMKWVQDVSRPSPRPGLGCQARDWI